MVPLYMPATEVLIVNPPYSTFPGSKRKRFFFWLFLFSLIHRAVVPSNAAVQIRHRQSQLKIVRMTTISVVAFVLSWSPFCFVSLAAIFTGNHVIQSGKAEIAELFAKASVIYNPIVYTIMNSRFRATLLHILHVRRRTRVLVQDLTLPLRAQRRVRNGTDCHSNTGKYARQRQLLQVPSFETGFSSSVVGNFQLNK